MEGSSSHAQGADAGPVEANAVAELVRELSIKLPHQFALILPPGFPLDLLPTAEPRKHARAF